MAAKKRVFVLGIDGVPHSLLMRFGQEGVMPQMARLMNESNSCQMDSVLPTVSNVAWATFLTGKNPGQFDIFGFAEVGRDMQLRMPNGQNLRSETLPEIVSRAGGKVVCLGVPSSYPPRPINGLLAGCFLSPSLDKAVYPPGRLEELSRLGYQLDIDPMRARQEPSYLRRGLTEALEGRRRAVEALFDKEGWDLFVLHVMETDRLYHFMWKQWETGKADEKAFFEGLHRKVDELIGYIADRMGGDDVLIIMSDHGFCSIEAEVQLNRWLMGEGYLQVGGDLSQLFGAISPGSKAFALVPGRIHIMRQDVYARGGVKPGDYAAIRAELIEKLGKLADPKTGRPLCKAIRTREEVYHGPYVDHAPDIVIDPIDGFDLKANLSRGELFEHTPLTGMHTRHDAFFMATGRQVTRERRCVIDTTRTILDLLGINAPADMDSRGMLA